MKIVAVSDTHNYTLGDIPDGDLFIHAGDLTGQGTAAECKRGIDMIAKLPHPVKVFVPGNHDWWFMGYGGGRNYKRTWANASAVAYCKERNIHCLVDKSLKVGNYNLYGSPWQPEFCNWAFNLPRGAALKKKWAKIPNNTDILVTHGPEYGIRDLTYDMRNVGDQDLSDRIKALPNLKLHIFGHIHASYGSHTNIGGVTSCNVCVCNEKYLPVNPPTVLGMA